MKIPSLFSPGPQVVLLLSGSEQAGPPVVTHPAAASLLGSGWGFLTPGFLCQLWNASRSKDLHKAFGDLGSLCFGDHSGSAAHLSPSSASFKHCPTLTSILSPMSLSWSQDVLSLGLVWVSLW